MKLNSYFSIQQIGGSTVLLPSGKTGWRNHGVIQLNNKEEVAVVRYLVKDTTEEEIINKLAQEVIKPKDELKTFVQNVIKKLRESNAVIE